MFGMLVYLDTRPLSNGHVSAVDYHMNLSNANAASYPGPGYVLAPAYACGMTWEQREQIACMHA
jgi:hypothetical protein